MRAGRRGLPARHDLGRAYCPRGAGLGLPPVPAVRSRRERRSGAFLLVEWHVACMHASLRTSDTNSSIYLPFICNPLPNKLQVRDEKRTDFDAGRGGYGRAAMYQSVPEPAAEAPQAADPGACCVVTSIWRGGGDGHERRIITTRTHSIQYMHSFTHNAFPRHHDSVSAATGGGLNCDVVQFVNSGRKRKPMREPKACSNKKEKKE